MINQAERQGKAVMTRDINGTQLKIKIYSQCPYCQIIKGLVTNDKEPINYRVTAIGLSKNDLEEIPKLPCNREGCKSQRMKQQAA